MNTTPLGERQTKKKTANKAVDQRPTDGVVPQRRGAGRPTGWKKLGVPSGGVSGKAAGRTTTRGGGVSAGPTVPQRPRDGGGVSVPAVPAADEVAAKPASADRSSVARERGRAAHGGTWSAHVSCRRRR